MKKLLSEYLFSKSLDVIKLNAILLIIAVIGNIKMQAFCQPTNWAAIVLMLCFFNSVFYPFFLKYEKYIEIVSFLNGISICVFIYCIIFLEQMNYLGIIGILLGIGLIVFIPHFFVVQLFWKGFIQLNSTRGRKFFIVGIMASLSLLVISGKLYQNALLDIEDFKESNYQTLNKTFMTEKILGTGIIYHIKFCEFDGWRPPKHEPLLNIGIWLSNTKRPLDIGLEKRVELYKKFFPEKTLKFNCSCAINYSETYHQDELWK
jgi:hypothetical protein